MAAGTEQGALDLLRGAPDPGIPMVADDHCAAQQARGAARNTRC